MKKKIVKLVKAEFVYYLKSFKFLLIILYTCFPSIMTESKVVFVYLCM